MYRAVIAPNGISTPQLTAFSIPCVCLYQFTMFSLRDVNNFKLGNRNSQISSNKRRFHNRNKCCCKKNIETLVIFKLYMHLVVKRKDSCSNFIKSDSYFSLC